MSVSHNYYGQHHQPPIGHFHQPPQQQYYPPPPPPPPQPMYAVDPGQFRADFNRRLQGLTENNRLIIQGLCMMAQDYPRYAGIVTESIDNHIRRVRDYTMKLPAFYLIDMISKNVHNPYARFFSAFIVPLFLDTFRLVDHETRNKMVELVNTWRTGSPTQDELFGIKAQREIEHGIWGDGSSQASSSSGPDHISTPQVLSELDFTLAQKQRAVASNPYDNVSHNHINILQQLRAVVEVGVSQAELQQIRGKLRAVSRENAAPQPPQPTAQPAWSGQYPNQQPFPQPVAPQPLPSQPIASTSTAPPASLTSLLSTISNIFSNSGTPVNAVTVKEEDQMQNMEREASRAYRNAVLTQPIQLSTADITRKRPHIHHFLYEQLSAQCKQCGIRFADTAVGKKALQDHMDMHFHRNRRVNQTNGRGHSRSWFVGLEDWIHESTDRKGKGRLDGSHPLNAKAAAAAESAKREAELRAQYVVVPPGDEAKVISCPICKESLKCEFLEDDEEWVWKNAVKKDEQIYHATCHAEALSGGTLAARLRNELLSQSRSRSATPDLQSNKVSTPPRTLKSLSPSPDSKAGLKRKADNELSALNSEAEGTPPAKKLALTVGA